ncbi:MAG: FtsX-like permease family protein [Cytophagales bacterium]|nr:FtsX-like permease family protein [Cytophagales bacterium]
MNTSLYRSYVKVALRNTRKNLGPVLINIIGLGLSLGFCFTVYMLHAYNLEFDFFHKNSADVHRMHSIRWYNEQPLRYEYVPIPFIDKVEEEIPGVEEVTYFDIHQATLKVANTNYQSSGEYFSQAVASARSNFLDMFDLPLKSGSNESLQDESAVFITEETAEQLFDDLSPIGETITIFIGQEKGIDLQVAGVFEKIPLNTSFHFDVLVNHEAVLKVLESSASSWKRSDNVALLFRSKVPDQVAVAVQEFLPEQNEKQENWKISEIEVHPLIDPLLTDGYVYSSPTNNRVRASALIIFSIMALLILLITCFNLANTSIALMTKRVREIGIRKTLGTTNFKLFEQFMMEMLVITFFAFIIALLMANPISEQLFGLFGVSFLLQDVSILRFIPFVLTFLLICTFLAGILPAMYAWKFSPSIILSGKQSLKGVGWFQKSLTIGQYVVSICLLICAWTFGQNNKYLGEIDLGYNYNQVAMLPLDSPQDFEQVRNDLNQLASTTHVIGTQHHHGAAGVLSTLASDTADLEITTFKIGEGYLETMEINVTQGRKFITGSESDRERSIIVSEEFAFRYLDQSNPLGQQVEFDGVKRIVVGVASDIIHEVFADYKRRPVAYLAADPTNYGMLILKTTASDTEALENELKAYWSDNFDTPYRGQGQRMISSFYATRDARNLKLIFMSIAILGSLLSTIGIFSLAVMNIAKRTKEISIRRVLGATSRQVLVIIYRSFGWIIGLSIVLGIVSGVFLSKAVLSSIYKFYLSAPILDSTMIGLSIMIIAILFITAAAFSRIIANPSEGLRTE